MISVSAELLNGIRENIVTENKILVKFAGAIFHRTTYTVEAIVRGGKIFSLLEEAMAHYYAPRDSWLSARALLGCRLARSRYNALDSAAEAPSESRELMRS